MGPKKIKTLIFGPVLIVVFTVCFLISVLVMSTIILSSFGYEVKLKNALAGPRRVRFRPYRNWRDSTCERGADPRGFYGCVA